ncbi:MAG: DUF2877 domain-containing protein [bacterium]
MRDAHGCVVSAYTRAVNLLLDDGTLVALLAPGSPLHPWAIMPAADMATLQPGMEARISRHTLEAGRLVLQFARAEIADLRILFRPSAPPNQNILESLEELTSRQCPSDCLQDAVVRNKIHYALHRFESCGDVHSLAELLGLGPGLTPSGDDVLLGILAALDTDGGFEPRATIIRSLLISALPASLEQFTPLISAQMLRAACDGHYPEPVVDLAHMMADPAAPPDARQTVLRVLSIGHSSGYYILRGFASAARLGWAMSHRRQDKPAWSAWQPEAMSFRSASVRFPSHKRSPVS